MILLLLSGNNILKNFSNDQSLKELRRITSPDKKVDAVLIETNGGATTSFGNAIFLVVAGKQIFEDDIKFAVFNSDHYRGVDIKWESDKQLLISYYKARIFHFTNFWESGDIDNWNYVVEIKLQCLSTEGQLLNSDQHNQ